MYDIAGISIQKWIEFILSVVGLILLLVGGSPVDELTTVTIIIVIYLAVYIVMSCTRRGMGNSAALECAVGVDLLIWTIRALFHSNLKGAILGAHIVLAILGHVFLVVNLLL